MIAGRMEPFDRDDLLVGNIFHRGDAGTHRLPAGMHGACPAKRLAAAIFRSGEANLVAKVPEQRQRRIAIPLVGFSVDGECDHGGAPIRSGSYWCGRNRSRAQQVEAPLAPFVIRNEASGFRLHKEESSSTPRPRSSTATELSGLYARRSARR